MKLSPYRRFFSSNKFWGKLGKFAKTAGTKTVYSALLLYYAYERKDTPNWAKRVVLGALGYFLMPFDMIPDLSPILGYTDDIGVLSFGLVTVAAYINKDVKAQARKKLGKWFKNPSEEDLQEVDRQLE